MQQLTSTALRGLTLVAKFGFILTVSKFLSPEEVGLYGLLFAMIVFSLMVIGFDYYTFANRELIAAPKDTWSRIARDQFIFYLISYVVALPILILIFVFNWLPWSIIYWFFALLAAEHIAQELNRLLIAMQKPLFAGFVMFIRQGLWALIAIGLITSNVEYRDLSIVFTLWLLGVSVAIVVAVTKLRSLGIHISKAPVEWMWIMQGIKKALPFFLAAVSFQALYTIDRYWLASLSTLSVVAAYVVFISVANAIQSFLDSAVFSFSYPRLVAAARDHQTQVYRSIAKKLTLQTVSITALLAAASVVSIHPLLVWLQKPSYEANIDLFYWSLLGSCLLVLSNIPHYCLYAKCQDSIILVSHLSTVFVFVVVTYCLIPILGHASVPAGMALAFLFLLIFKTLAVWMSCSDLGNIKSNVI
jgi:O-antigen/teichoic acid export membrane protein